MDKKRDKQKPDELVEEFLTRRQSGEEIDPDEFTRQFPEIQEELRNLFRKVEEKGVLSSGGDRLSGEPPKILGDFRIVREIGRGGMGTVFEAEQISLGRRVALKVLPPHLSYSDDAVRKFRREAEAGGRQSHTGIVAVYAVGEHEGVHFIAQELIEGDTTLSDRLVQLQAEGTLPRGYFRETARLMAEVADALQHAHESGVIHRDVKPSNILLTPDGFPKVTDFGLAKVEDALALSRSGEFAGTPYYMSPEQAASRRIGIDSRTDIFSLGATFYEMLALIRPFEGETSQEVLKKILLFEPKDPRKVNGRVPHDLAVICLKAMEKDPNRRYQTMIEFGDDLRRFLSGDVILARPAGAWVRLAKRIKRNRALSAAMGIALLSLLGLIASIPWYVIQISHEKSEAINQRALAESQRAIAQSSEIRAREAMNEAIRERDGRNAALVEKQRALLRAEGLHLAARSSLALREDPGLALLLAVESAQRTPGLYANNALLDALEHCAELKTIRRNHPLDSAAFSPDGKKIVLARDLYASIVDAATGETLTTLKGHGSNVTRALFSPDGRLVATASKDYTARIWDAATGQCLTVLAGHEAFVSDIDFSADGERLLTAGFFDGTFRLWDVATGEMLGSFGAFDGFIYAARLSADGRRAALALSDQNSIQIWDLSSGRCALDLSGQKRCADSVAFSPDGTRIATASRDGAARVWNARTGDCLLTITGHQAWVNMVEFSPDGRSLVTACDDRTVRLFDAGTGREIASFRGHTKSVNSARFSRSGDSIVTASADGTARVWRASAKGALVTLEEDDDRPIVDVKRRSIRVGTDMGILLDYLIVDLSPDGSKVITVSEDDRRIARLWKTEGGELLAILEGHEGTIVDARFSPNGRMVATAGSWDETVRVWDAATGRPIITLPKSSAETPGVLELLSSFNETRRSITVDSHLDGANTVRFSPDSSRIVTAGRVQFDEETNEELRVSAEIYDLETGTIIASLGETGDFIWSADFSPDGRSVIAVMEDKSVRLFDAATGEGQLTLAESGSYVYTARFSPDGSLIVTADTEDRCARLFDAAGGEEKLRLPTAHHAYAADFSGDGQRVLVVSQGRIADQVPAVQVFNALSGEELYSIDHQVSKHSVPAFSPDGALLITGHDDGTASVWNAISGEQIMTLRGHEGAVLHTSFSADSRTALTASEAGTVRIWPLDLAEAAAARTPRHLTREEKERFSAWDQGEKAAAELVDDLFDEWAEADGVIEQLGAMNDLDAKTRRTAIGLAESRRRRPEELVEECWKDLWRPPDSPDAARSALRLARAACKRLPDESTPLTALGAAQYRSGLYAEACDTLAESEDRLSREGRLSLPLLAFSAMARFREGDRAAAKSYLFQLMNQKTFLHAEDPSSRRLERLQAEADRLVFGAGAEAARKELASLCAAPLLVDEIRERLKSEKNRSPATVERALQMIDGIGDDPRRLVQVAYGIVSAPGGDEESAGAALKLARTACRLEPRNGQCLKVLGQAQYRLGLIEQSLASLEKARELFDEDSRMVPSNIIFLAMALQRTGRGSEARETFDQARKLLRKPEWQGAVDLSALLEEARRLIEKR